jgi:hypothetical protein
MGSSYYPLAPQQLVLSAGHVDFVEKQLENTWRWAVRAMHPATIMKTILVSPTVDTEMAI